MLQFTAKAIKATLVPNAAEVAATDVVGDTVVFTIAVGDQWAYEPKYDGFRAIVFVDGDEWTIQSRSGRPLLLPPPPRAEPAGDP